MTNGVDDVEIMPDEREYTFLSANEYETTRVDDGIELTEFESFQAFTFVRPLTLEHRS